MCDTLAMFVHLKPVARTLSVHFGVTVALDSSLQKTAETVKVNFTSFQLYDISLKASIISNWKY